jgi:hypothetical protein
MKYHMKVVLTEICGYSSSMIGLSLMKKQPIENMPKVASKLGRLDHGHNKFLEHIYLWMLVEAPRYWWQEADTYRHGSKQSQSTMYDLMKFKPEELIYSEVKKLIEDEDLSEETYLDILSALNLPDKTEKLVSVKRRLPEGFLQQREWVINLKTYREMVIQRLDHKLPHWIIFLRLIYKLLPDDCKRILGLDNSTVCRLSIY